jgi:DNA-binding transcriptional regulator/RsmH inhibitor MraZ
MMDFAGIVKDASILGVGERIELWSTSKWNTYNKKAAATFQRLGKHLEI